MTTADDGYDYWDALERMDLAFDDFDDEMSLRDALREVLGRVPTQRQVDKAAELLGPQRDIAVEAGITVARFVRRGVGVAALRDSRGRFVGVEGGRAIRERLERGG